TTMFRKSVNLTNSEAKIDLTNSEEHLYLLAKKQSFADWKSIK
ncbi:9947_t:CDS:1, partial [Racocetra persica]